MSQREVVIVSGARTAVGSYGGSLKDYSANELATLVTQEALERSGADKADIGHCVFGTVLTGDRRDMYLSRVAALNSGLAETTPAFNVNRLCGSGLQAVVSATQAILLGDCDAAVAGGAECMSNTPYWLPTTRFGQRMGHGELQDPMIGALTCPMNDYHMGVTAENLAEKFDISREQQDELAVSSHNRAQRAIEEGRFDEQIMPVPSKNKRKPAPFEKDEHVRLDATIEGMAGLRPAFKKDGSVTAGNASGLNDGAAALVLMEKSAAQAKGLKPLATIKGYAIAGVDPSIMGYGPVPAVQKLLEKTGVSADEIDFWESNEAFAAQALSVSNGLELDSEKVNPNGSGISLGHPVGATGAIMTVKAMYELERTNARYAVCTMCIGGGQGIAVLLERG